MRKLKPRIPGGGMLVFPQGLDYALYQSAVMRVLACYSTQEWQFGQGFRGKAEVDGLVFDSRSLTVEITGISRTKLLEAASNLTRKCAVAKVMVKDFEWGDWFSVSRAPAKMENYDDDFVNSFYRALEAEKVIRGNEFERFLEKKKYRFPGELFYHIRKAKKYFLRYFFLTIDKYPHNTNFNGGFL